ncbi:MAG: NUDIX hydrolase, partial [Clostridia bacterium]|nr:NUDIX hydrolase [Clostridia bacterium]
MLEKTITSEIAYNGKFIKVKKDKVLLESGKESFREVMLHPGACAVLPILPDGRIILIRQFRYAFMKDFLEIPAGKIDEGEDILTCARRELSEEIGYDCENMRYLGKICP